MFQIINLSFTHRNSATFDAKVAEFLTLNNRVIFEKYYLFIMNTNRDAIILRLYFIFQINISFHNYFPLLFSTILFQSYNINTTLQVAEDITRIICRITSDRHNLSTY